MPSLLCPYCGEPLPYGFKYVPAFYGEDGATGMHSYGCPFCGKEIRVQYDAIATFKAEKSHV